MEKINSIIEKINKYANLDFTLKKYLMFSIFIFIIFFIIYMYFDKSWDYIKDNLIKWDKFCFLKVTLLMIIPILSILSLKMNLLSNQHLNNWLHFFAIFFIIPIFPYIFMCFYRCLYLCIRKIVYYCFKKKHLINTSK